jgi:HNH endonuclease
MVSNEIRRFVRQRAQSLCEYCHSPEYLSPDRFTLDHLLPQSLGGSDDQDNLALACHRCNERHYNFITGIDPDTTAIVPLFNPRQQQWVENFVWTANGLKILGITPIGRATCQRLDFNDSNHDDGAILTARWFWVKGGWHPPANDPKLTT